MLSNFFFRLKNSKDIKNSIWNIFSVLINPILLLIATPIFISKLGTSQYGIWMLINTIVAFMGAFNFGLGDASIKYISKYKANSSLKDETRIFQGILSLTIVMMLIIISIGFIIPQLLKIYDPFSLDTQILPTIQKLLPVAAFLFALRQLESAILSVYKAYERFDFSSYFLIGSKTLLILAQLIVLVFNGQLFEMLIAAAISLCLFIIIEIYLLKRIYNHFSVCPWISKKTFQEIFNFGFWSWIQSLLGIASDQIDKFVVAMIAGVEVLGLYSIAHSVAMQLHALIAAGSAWIFPKVSRSIEQQENPTSIFIKNHSRIVPLSIIIIAMIIYFEHFIFSTWLGDKTYQNAKIFLNLFLNYEALMILTIVPFYFLSGSGKIKFATALTTFSIILTIAGTYFGFYLFGEKGIILGRIIALLINIPISFILIKKLVLKDILYRDLVLPILPIVLLLLEIIFPTEHKVFILGALFMSGIIFVLKEKR